MRKKDTYGENYTYLKVHFEDWKRPVYRLWWLVRAVIEIALPIRLSRGSRVLSVGAGLGQIECYLSKLFSYQVYLVDISSHAKKLNRKLFSEMNYKIAEASKLPFPNKTFDLIISYNLMEHLRNEREADMVLKEMERVLKPKKGINMFHKITVTEEREINADPTHHLKWSSEEWQKWFKERGWNTVKPTSHYIPVWAKRRLSFLKVYGAFYLSE